MASVSVIAIDNTIKTNVTGFRDYVFTKIFNDMPVISFGARNINRKMLKFLKFSLSNTLGTLLVDNKDIYIMSEEFFCGFSLVVLMFTILC
jgi:hypothetical protein